MNEFKFKNSIKYKILGIVFFGLFLITGSLGCLSFLFSKDRIVGMLGDSLKGISSAIAGFTSSEDISLILQNAEKIVRDTIPKEPNNVYEKYSTLLRDIQKTNNIDGFINIYVASGNRLLLTATSEPTFMAGAAYTMRQEAKEAVISGLAQTTPIYRDKDGVWISAYAPGGRLPFDNRRIIVGIDYKVDAYIRILNQELGVIIIICIIGFLTVAFISYYLVTGLVSAIKNLNEAVVDLEHENYDKPIDIATNDEVGHLSAAFEALRVSLKKKIDELRLSLTREKKAHLESVLALTNAIEARDSYTKEHVSRVEEYALLIAKAMHLPHDKMVQLSYSCFLHDVGKIYLEGALLRKGKLTYEDFEEIKKHSEQGAKIIDGIDFLTEVKDIVLYHQERYDGTGYPKGLKGKEIPLLARIVSVADAFDAMTTDRPYRLKMSFDAAIKEIESNSGIQFDPDVCAAFLKYKDTIAEIVRKRLNGAK